MNVKQSEREFQHCSVASPQIKPWKQSLQLQIQTFKSFWYIPVTQHNADGCYTGPNALQCIYIHKK